LKAAHDDFSFFLFDEANWTFTLPFFSPNLRDEVLSLFSQKGGGRQRLHLSCASLGAREVLLPPFLFSPPFLLATLPMVDMGKQEQVVRENGRLFLPRQRLRTSRSRPPALPPFFFVEVFAARGRYFPNCAG